MKSFKQQTEPQILKRLANVLGTEIHHYRLEIPEKFGSGYCMGFVFNEHIRMMIFNYELNEELVIENPDLSTDRTILLLRRS